MNEAQFHQYIQNLINEELENEGFGGRLWGGIKGVGNAFRGEHNMPDGTERTFKDKIRSGMKMVKGQAKQGDMAQELNKLKDTIFDLELNGYFNKATDSIAREFYKALDRQITTGENFNVKGVYKKNYGQSMPQKQQYSNGMGNSHRDTSWDYNGFGSGAVS